MVFAKLFNYLDKNRRQPKVKLFNQLLPVIICLILFGLFMLASWYFIEVLINPYTVEKIQLKLYPVDVLIGFFLYFVTAVDYALIVGRMQVNNPGSKARVIMNIFTCLGCFVGVSLVLFLWGFAKDIIWLIIPVLIFAGSVMIKLAFEGIEYFEDVKAFPLILRKLTVKVLQILHFATIAMTFWIPELGSPKVKKMSAFLLAQWSFLLPFIIGLDDLVGYMGAMTIYNVFSLLFGIYLADILIDIIIFVSPKFTKKLVESAILSLLAAYAFLYLGYKSFSEALLMLHEHYHLPALDLILMAVLLVAVSGSFNYWVRSDRQ